LCACFFFSSRRRHTRSKRDWSSDVCSSDLHLRAKLREARTVRYVLTGLEPSRLDDTPLAPSRPDNSREDHHAKKRANADRAAQQIGRASCRESVETANVGRT